MNHNFSLGNLLYLESLLPHWCDFEIPHVFPISLEFPVIFLLSSMGVAGGLSNK